MLAAAAAAVWVALWTDRRAARRLRDEHERSDRLLSAAAGQLGARLIQVVPSGSGTIQAPWLQ
jgi:hypothetical protein